MNKNYLLPFLLCIILSCSTPKVYIPGNYENKPVVSNNYNTAASPSSIKQGLEMQQEYPKEEWVYDFVDITLQFEKNEQYDTLAYFNMKDTLVDYQSEDEEIEEEEDNTEEDEYHKDSVWSERPLPNGEVFVRASYDYNFISVRDFNKKSFVIPFSSMDYIYRFNLFIDGKKISNPRYRIVSTDGDEYFKTDTRYKVYSLSLPIVGTSVNIKYNEKCRDAKFSSVYYIPENSFVKKKVIKISYPDWLKYEIIPMNFEQLDYSLDTVWEVPKNNSMNKTEDDNRNTKEKQKFLRFTFKNVKPFQNVKSQRGHSYNYPLLFIQYKQYETKNGKQSLLNSTDDLYHWYRLATGNLNNDTTQLAPFTRKLVANETNDIQKIKKVFYWIQDNIRYVAYEDGIAGFRPEECHKVFKFRYGDCKGMANLCKTMLRILGYQANMVWIGTNHLNFSYDKPGLPVDNHAICRVNIGDTAYFLDATETFCPLGYYANRIQGRECMVENGKKYQRLRVPSFDYKYNLEQTTEEISIQNDTLILKATKTFQGESKLSFLRDYNNLRSQQKDRILYEYLTNNEQNIIASNISSSDLTNRNLTPELKYQLTILNNVISVDKKKFVKLELDGEFANFRLDSTRKIDYNLYSKIYIDKVAKVNLLPKQTIVYLPPPVYCNNDYYTISLKMEKQGNQLIYHKQLIFKKDYLPVNMFKTFNNDCQKLTEFYNTYIQIEE